MHINHKSMSLWPTQIKKMEKWKMTQGQSVLQIFIVTGNSGKKPKKLAKILILQKLG